MSNFQAIAAVTATLQSILQAGIMAEPDLNDIGVTILPLDRARGANTTNQLNLFLYLVARNPAWVNADMPRQVRQGETGPPPLPLTLFYLITAFGRDDDAAAPFGHEVLGKAMTVLHDHSVLSAQDIRNAVQAILPESNLDLQLERVRISFQPLTLDELSKLWTGFGMQYRLSAAYEVAVMLLESTRPTKTPLPVLTRGPADSGFLAQSNLDSPFPTLVTLTPQNAQPSALLGDLVSLTGAKLAGSNVEVRFMHPLWSVALEVAPEPGGTSAALTVRIPIEPAIWPCGFYTVDVLVQLDGETFRRSTNRLALLVGPAITISPVSAPAGAVTFTVSVTPDVWPGQRASLMLGDAEFLADPYSSKTSTLTFSASDLAVGRKLARLRVDGVDSLAVDRTASPPVFDPKQQVVLT